MTIVKIDTATLLYWSPTGTTRKILHAIAEGMGIATPKAVSLTRPPERARELAAVDTDVLVIGMPVYEEKVPSLVLPYLRQLRGNRQPAVVVAVYGNVGVGITLQQLSGVAEAQGFPIVGGASFIGEHSFSHEALPIAVGRPNAQDLDIARDFGARIRTKLASTKHGASFPRLTFPGRLPLKSRILPENSARMFTETPATDPDTCTRCGACTRACPMGAIDASTLEVAEQLCLRCFACVRTCPQKARSIKLKKAFLVRRTLSKAMQQQQQPRLYL